MVLILASIDISSNLLQIGILYQWSKDGNFKLVCCITIRMSASNGLRYIYCTERNHKDGNDKSHNQKQKTTNENNVQTLSYSDMCH